MVRQPARVLGVTRASSSTTEFTGGEGYLKEALLFPAASCLIRGPTPGQRSPIISLFLEYLKTCLIVLVPLFSSGSFLAS